MKKRLRKKLHKGEFQEFGFQMEVIFDPPLSDEVNDEYIDRFLNMIEARTLEVGGGLGPDRWDGFIAGRKGSAKNEDRDQVQKWIDENLKPKLIRMEELRDVWNRWE